eukprot:5262828-Alexandrium_andersonii.AAC.1
MNRDTLCSVIGLTTPMYVKLATNTFKLLPGSWQKLSHTFVINGLIWLCRCLGSATTTAGNMRLASLRASSKQK